MYAFCKTLGVGPSEYYNTDIEDISKILSVGSVFNKLEKEEHDKIMKGMK